jgi:hypothetical protein
VNRAVLLWHAGLASHGRGQRVQAAAHARQRDHGEQGQAHAREQEAGGGCGRVFAGALADHGRKDDVARAEEQRKGHEA